MPDKSTQVSPSHQPPAWRVWLLLVLASVATFVLGILGASIVQRREEARERLPLKTIGPWEVDNAKWGENYPREYASYKEMYDLSKHTKYVGPFPRDYLADTPANVVLFAGYGFAKDYNQARGHVYAIEDVTRTKRVTKKTAAACWTCKSPDVPRLIAQLGPEKFYSGKFADFKDQITHPIGCLDCHEPNTMKLRISRPALREALQRQGKDVDQLSHQEMRTLVCAQCHVEYYFKPENNYLAFPWDKGTTPEQMDEYYAAYDFSDWTHAISKAQMVKIQHPDYEVYRTGVHAYRDIACADCHMPYRTEGGAKFTDHHLQSPLLNIANSCVVCHRWSEEEIKSRVQAIQDKVHEGRAMAESMLTKAHFDVAAAQQAGAADAELAGVRKLVRQAQLRWDYVAANNGMGFHSPQECMRILASAIDLAAQCRVECALILAKHGVIKAVEYPDASSKEKAQALIKQFIEGNPAKLF
jgi:nitrite reductase (cytochrome c-552)